MSAEGRFTRLMTLIEEYWGYHTLRPLQEEAMRAVLGQRDSLTVMPTGSGKSLCFQAPALLNPERPTLVISPLIALMKDQVDRLRSIGINAYHIDHTLTASAKREVYDELKCRRVPLLFVAPERLMLPQFQDFLQTLDVTTFVIDEAHCISHWGHDFRPEYRQISTLRQRFPQANFHGYTATATEQVRADIAAQLQLRNPTILVGDFDRKNLTYRILPRGAVTEQVIEVLERHREEAGIIYCFRKREVDDLTMQLNQKGYSARAYHADLTAEARRDTHEAFRREECNLIVATVAFGMGIDRSNIRFVIHAAMPSSIEHYQQETGRAGRDGLEAECVLLYSGKDVMVRKFLHQKEVDEGTLPRERLPVVLHHIEEMSRFCRTGVCRHRFLVEHFAQTYPSLNCGACDICLSEVEFEDDSTVIAQKILSCVHRTQERYGVGHVCDVLHGAKTERIKTTQHDKLTTYGLLKDYPTAQIRDWVYQLINQDLLEQTDDEYPKLALNALSWEVMRKQREVKLLRSLKRERAKTSRAASESWEGVDVGLADHLRRWRVEMALSRKMPPYTIFDDRTLRELCRVRPSSLEKLRYLHGIGDRRLKDYGEGILNEIREYCARQGLELDQTNQNEKPTPPPKPKAVQRTYFPNFERGESISQVAAEYKLTPMTIRDHLCTYIEIERPRSIDAWVEPEVQDLVREAARKVGIDRLKPIYLELGESIPYDAIAVVVSHLRAGR